ncbi:MAG TPA: signal peptide peptidase SppA [Gemmatimonadota bacterium]|nr:signal peptide peptidase SppA [Gemmatimonadota bacterium]
MKRTLLILLAVLAGVAILVFAGAMLLAPFFRYDRRVEVDAPAILAIDLQGLIVERSPPEFFAAELEGAEHQMHDLRLALERAAHDDRIAGVHLRVGDPGYGWAKAEELRAALADFRENGKFIYAFTSITDELGYYVALSADSLFLLPGSGIEMNGFRVETPFVQEMFEKVGIVPQVEAIGVYKSAADMFRRTNMSEPDREATQAILDGIYGRFVDAVTETRGVDRDRFVRGLDQGVYLSRDLQALGLVDGELHDSEVRRRAVARALEADPDSLWPEDVEGHVVDVRDYAATLPEGPKDAEGTIGLVYAVGAITGGESGFDPIFGRTMGAETMKRLLREVAEDGSLDAVVIRVDSPGGDAIASEEIWGAVEALREFVPVVVSMGDVAASGGYYMSAGADQIVASASTLTGSIGVFGVLFDASEVYDKLGIDWDTMETNPAADFPTSIRPLSEEERQTFRRLIEHTYRSFIGRVAEGRGMTEAEVDAVAQGRVWSGSAAAERGLVDVVGGLEEALASAKEEAGLDREAPVRLHVYPREQTLLDRLRDALYLQRLGGARSAGAPASMSPRERAAVLALGDLVKGLAGFGVALRQGPGRAVAALPWIPAVR